MHEKFLADIGRYLTSTFFLSSEVSKLLVGKLTKLPDEGLQEIIGIFEEAKKKQDAIFTSLNQKNLEFSKELQTFLKKGYAKYSGEVTESEHQEAEDLLKQV